MSEKYSNSMGPKNPILKNPTAGCGVRSSSSPHVSRYLKPYKTV